MSKWDFSTSISPLITNLGQCAPQSLYSIDGLKFWRSDTALEASWCVFQYNFKHYTSVIWLQHLSHKSSVFTCTSWIVPIELEWKTFFPKIAGTSASRPSRSPLSLLIPPHQGHLLVCYHDLFLKFLALWLALPDSGACGFLVPICWLGF